MKDSGQFLIILGLVYGMHKLIGTEPNVNGWWFQLGLGVLVYWLSVRAENKAKRKREAETARRMQDLADRQEAWLKEHGL